MNVILHLGLGSFHRAHLAVYLHELIRSGDTGWQLAGGNTRPDMAETIAALQAQGGAYTLETISPAGEHRYTRIGSIRQVMPARVTCPVTRPSRITTSTPPIGSSTTSPAQVAMPS